MSIFHRHKWTDWAATERGALIDPWGHLVGAYIDQERFCLTCGKTQMSEDHTGSSPWTFTRVPHKSAAPKHDRTPA